MGFFRKLGRALDPTRRGSLIRRAAVFAPGLGWIGHAANLAQGGTRGLVQGAVGSMRDAAILGAGALALPAVAGVAGSTAGALGTAAGAVPGAARGLLGGAGRVASGVLGQAGNVLRSPGLLQTGLGILGTVQGAQREGQANRLREQALANLGPTARPDLSATFADEGNPYAQPRRNTALQAARTSLRGY